MSRVDDDSHTPMDDLESFFWLLAWIAIRYKNYGRTSNSISTVYSPPNAQAARAYKIEWLKDITLGKEIVMVKRNKPLKQLFDQLARLLLVPDLDHSRMLRVFEDALDSQGWPEDDAHVPIVHRGPDSRPNYYYYAFQLQWWIN